MSLFHWTSSEVRRIAVVGMAKNAGKTVTLNALIAEAAEEHVTLGLTSIGRDGEREDRVTMTEKPSIYVEEGTLIATASTLFNGAEARLEVLDVTDLQTPMGEVVIGRALSPGFIELAGPVTNSGIRRVTDEMLRWGAQKVLVDGAIDRVSSASPAVCEACILSTGAVLSRDMQMAVRLTQHRVGLLGLEPLEGPALRAMAEEVFEADELALIAGGEMHRIASPSALLAGRKIAGQLTEETTHVLIPGALVDRTLRDLFADRRYLERVTVVVKDGTRLFIDPMTWEKWRRAGLRVVVKDPIRLLGLTVNPFSPEGYYFHPERFVKGLREALPDLTVVDVLGGGETI
jgi:hypothetical protein